MAVKGVTVEGAEALERTLRAAGKAMADMEAQHHRAAALVVRAAAARAPRRTGVLASSIGATTDHLGAWITAGVRYAAPVESGVPAHRQAARPYLRNTLDDQTEAITDLYATRLDSILGTVKGV